MVVYSVCSKQKLIVNLVVLGLNLKKNHSHLSFVLSLSCRPAFRTIQNIIMRKWILSFGGKVLVNPAVKSVQQVKFQHFDTTYTELAIILRSPMLVGQRYVIISATGTSPLHATMMQARF